MGMIEVDRLKDDTRGQKDARDLEVEASQSTMRKKSKSAGETSGG